MLFQRKWKKKINFPGWPGYFHFCLVGFPIRNFSRGILDMKWILLLAMYQSFDTWQQKLWYSTWPKITTIWRPCRRSYVFVVCVDRQTVFVQDDVPTSFWGCKYLFGNGINNLFSKNEMTWFFVVIFEHFFVLWKDRSRSHKDFFVCFPGICKDFHCWSLQNMTWSTNFVVLKKRKIS